MQLRNKPYCNNLYQPNNQNTLIIANNNKNNNLNYTNNSQANMGNNFSQIDYLIKTNENIEDEDCDFMSNYNLNEFLYILKKCFEAQKINKGDIESKILNGETFNLLVKKENYNTFILTISANFCNLLKIIKIRDQLDMLSFVKTFLYNNFIANENKIDEFQNIFLNCFPDIIIYDKELDELYLKKISGYFKDKLDLFRNECESFDMNKKGTITFIGLKKIVEKLKINLKKEILEYMISFMKKSCINNTIYINKENKYSLRDLNYKALLEEIYIHINNNNIDTNDNSTNNEITENNNNYEGFLNGNNIDENSYIEITNEEYNEKIALIMSSIISEIIRKSNNSTSEYINLLFNKHIYTDDDGHQIIELRKLIEEIKNSLYIELNQIEIFCLYSKFKINEDKNGNNNELIDYEFFKNEIIFYEKQIKENSPIELINYYNKKNEKGIYNLENNIEKKVINKEEEKNRENKNGIDNKNIEDIKKDNSQMEEYNDFENNNFDNDEDSINKLEKIITGEDKE